jgi:solute carrier family 25 phosphate transporter 3
VTPIDVVKTKVQTDPVNYPGAIAGFKKLLDERGFGGFFAGWIPSFLGWFCWGGFSYSLTELLRRYLNEMAGADAIGLEVPISLTAAAIGAFFGVFILCPFESVRIRSVTQPGYGSNPLEILNRMIEVRSVSFL